MLIRWHGHACFEIITHHGKHIVTDPFDESVGYGIPRTDCDIVTISHAHHDHNCTDSLGRIGVVFDKAGDFEADGISVSAILSYHDEECGKKRGDNLIFKIRADGKTVVHLGDLGHMPTSEQYAFMAGADVLMIPIGGTYTITSEQAAKVIRTANPVCAVPMHFLTPALSFPITDEKAFANATNAVYLGKNEENVDFLRGCMIFDY